MKSIVYYTYLSKGYDNLSQHKYASKDCEYICFTNDDNLLKKEKIGIWTIRKSQFEELDAKRNSGWHKTHPHILFPEYEKSIWIDTNINVLTNELEKITYNTTKFLLTPKHNLRNCCYEEIKKIEQAKKDTPEDCKRTIDFLISEKMSKNYGLNETNIMYREHNNKLIKSIDELWWDCIKKYSKRDQACFSYCLWKHDITPESISIPNVRNNPNFDLTSHKQNSPMNLPKIFGKIICLFIPNKEKRRNFRKKHVNDTNTLHFYKERLPNGKLNIYFCGIKIFSYTHKKTYNEFLKT